MSRSTGPGSPLTFQCWKCRQGKVFASFGDPSYGYHNRRGRIDRVVLTGKTKKRGNRRHHCVGIRHGHVLHQYECLDCGHIGYSSHYEIERYGKKREDSA